MNGIMNESITSGMFSVFLAILSLFPVSFFVGSLLPKT